MQRAKSIKEAIESALKVRSSYPEADCVVTSGYVGEKEWFGFHFEPLHKVKRGDTLHGTGINEVFIVEAIL